MNNNNYSGFEVAVVGMSIRTSGSSNWREFWQNLISSKESLRFLTDEELIAAGMHKSITKDKNYVNCTTDIKNKDSFDSKFFGYSKDEAKMMYPGHRFFHECVWEALEDAGYIPENMKETVGIYAGAGEDILWKSFVALSEEKQKVNDFYVNTINNKDYLATLMSYKLGLRGPSIAIHTACSTSLVAIHTACKALIFGETKIAIAGASSLGNSASKGYIYEEGSIVSNDGHCKAFDKDSTGTVNGEGTGVVILKRLKDAIADKDNIYAVIKGSAVNNDGNNKVGFTAPSIEGQVACIKMAQKFSKVEPETIGYVEAHGTGTKLGDSIEVEALNIAFNYNKEMSCPIGSVKTNIGHLDTASGVAGFIKTVLSLKNKKIPASLHFTEPSPNINFQDGPFYVNNSLSEWNNNSTTPLRAAVNSFGVGGTNAHVILEEAPLTNSSLEKEYKLLTLSAKTETSLRKYLENFSAFLGDQENLNLSDMCYTYQTGRQNFENRISFSFQDKNELQQKINEIILDENFITKVKNTPNAIIFLFPGQGSQYVNMGKDLYSSNSMFKKNMDKGFELLYKLTNKDFKSILFPEIQEEQNSINNTALAQPILFLIEYSLAKLLIEYGIVPNYMVGHSIGEYTAACISGLFSFEQALQLVVKRGALMDSLPSGSMISVPIDDVKAQNFCEEGISLAALNAPNQVVFSGNDTAIEKLTLRLTSEDIPYIKLHTSHAFHSSEQDSILEEFKKEFKDIEFNTIEIPFISCLSGEFITNEEAASSDYWAKQLRNTVQFSKGINTISAFKNNVYVEVGAGSSLSSLVKQHKSEKNNKVVNALRPIKSIDNDERYFLDFLGSLWSHGVNINWQKFYKEEDRYRISLPTYAFDIIKYPAEIDHTKLLNGTNTILLNELDESFYFPSWKRSVLGGNNNSEIKSFLLFVDDSEYSEKIAEELKKSNHHIIEVFIGSAYIKHSSSKFSVDPFNSQNFNQLFLDLEADGLILFDVVYLWSLAAGPELELSQDNWCLNLTYFCPSRIIKAWSYGTDKKFFILSNLLHKAIGNENINYAHSLVLGLLKVMPMENKIIGTNIDIDLSDVNDKLIQNIALEITNNTLLSQRIVSYRLGQRWVPEFQRCNQDLTTEEISSFKIGGTYLITGGLGKLGFSISKYLINKYQANIVLAGRRDLTTILDSQELDAKNYNELVRLNSNVKYLSVDVSDRESVEETLLANKELFGEINGIIHLAKGDDNNLDFIENVSMEKSINMLKSKVNGIENLHEFFIGNDLDFIWMPSSLSATHGIMGLSAYISANIYLEYFAYSKSNKFKCVEIPKIIFESDNSYGQNVLTDQEVIQVLEKSLNIKNENVLFISKEDINLVLKTIENIQILDLDPVHNQAKVKVERPDLETEYLAPNTDIERRLKLIFEDYFEIDDVGIRDDFFDLGGDSLRAMVFLKQINKEFNVELSIVDFFANKNIQGISSLIDEKKWLTAEIDLENEMII
ncbi:type I polyketide synthase [Flavobacterium sp. N502540]|uniref:type I polyketide synthase n=1 Tax=Flavobacterium sp. N502540 TaxID=2986838 RepID=UPI0022246DD6|nr:type I polyketide synthase [Flavobacterium sp. N502540]